MKTTGCQAISWIHVHPDHARWNDSPQCAEGISKPWVVYASVIASRIHCDRLSSDTARPFAHHYSTQKLDRLPKTAWTVNVKSQKHWRGKLQSGRPHSVRAMIRSKDWRRTISVLSKGVDSDLGTYSNLGRRVTLQSRDRIEYSRCPQKSV